MVITTDAATWRANLPRLVICVWLSGVAAGLLCAPVALAEGLPQSAAVTEFTIRPSAAGRQLVRVSLPFRPGQLAAGQAVGVRVANERFAVAIRPLTYHGNGTETRFVRRALVTFPFDFKDEREVAFALQPATTPRPEPAAASLLGAMRVQLEGGDWVLTGSDRLVARRGLSGRRVIRQRPGNTKRLKRTNTIIGRDGGSATSSGAEWSKPVATWWGKSYWSPTFSVERR